MSTPKRQKTIVARVSVDGYEMFASMRIERKCITLHPSPALIFPLDDRDEQPDILALEERLIRLGQLLQSRWWGTA
ncbi:MAG: hypothetical protein IT337_13750 [Thermomicrobiales bacterium]|nr:hypothetical protein [Thermomicrobiales bacterium]